MGLNDQYPQQFGNKTKSSSNVTFVVVFIMVLVIVVMLLAISLIDSQKELAQRIDHYAVLSSKMVDLRRENSAMNSELNKQKSDLVKAHSEIRELKYQLERANQGIKTLEGQLANAEGEIKSLNEQNAMLVRENDHLFISNLLLEDRNDELAGKCDFLKEQNAKLANFLGIYILANAPAKASAKFDLDTLMNVFADFQENLSIICEKFALLQKEADEKEGWSESDYRQAIEKLLGISSETVQLRSNLYKHGLMDVHVYNFTGLFSCLKKRMDARKRPLKAEECEEIMNKLFEFNRNLFGVKKICN